MKNPALGRAFDDFRKQSKQPERLCGQWLRAIAPFDCMPKRRIFSAREIPVGVQTERPWTFCPAPTSSRQGGGSSRLPTYSFLNLYDLAFLQMQKTKNPPYSSPCIGFGFAFLGVAGCTPATLPLSLVDFLRSHGFGFAFLGLPPFLPLILDCSLPASVFGPVDSPPCHLHRPPS